jgi:hypothetical protein
VNKELTRNLLRDQGWGRLIREKNLTRGEMIHFNLVVQVPTIIIIYLSFVHILHKAEEEEEAEE